jgi:hypothetical protein
VSKRREGAGGPLAGGKRFSRGAPYLMLQNRLYRGEIVHQGTAYPGQHKAILHPELWQIVQDKLAASYPAPDIVRALLKGRQPIELTPTRLLRLSKDLPHDWSEQRRFLGFAA